MNKEQWKEIAHEIVPHLEAIRQVVERSEIDILSMYSGTEGGARAFYIDDSANTIYNIEIDESDIDVYMMHCKNYEKETIEEHHNRPDEEGNEDD